MADHNVIYLQPKCCADPYNGRQWCENDVFEECQIDCGDFTTSTKYVRADLVPTWLIRLFTWNK